MFREINEICICLYCLTMYLFKNTYLIPLYGLNRIDHVILMCVFFSLVECSLVVKPL